MYIYLKHTQKNFFQKTLELSRDLVDNDWKATSGRFVREGVPEESAFLNLDRNDNQPSEDHRKIIPVQNS